MSKPKTGKAIMTDEEIVNEYLGIRRKKMSADMRPLYFYADNEEITRFSKENVRR